MNKSANNNPDLFQTGKRRFGSIRKWALRVPLYFLFGIILLIGTGVLLLQTGLVRNMLRVFIIETANKRLNATVGIERIQGDFLSNISLEGISITMPEDQCVLSIERVSVSYLLPMVLAKVIHVDTARIKGLRLYLAKSSAGTWNISTLLKPSNKNIEDSGDTFPYLVAIRHFEISDTEIEIAESDQGEVTSRSIQIDRFAAGIKYGASVQLSNLESSLTARLPSAIPITLTGTVVFNPEENVLNVDRFSIQSGPSTIKVNGDCRFREKAPVVDCAIDLEKINLADIGQKLSFPGMPESGLSGDISVTGTLAAFRYQVSLRQEGAVLESTGNIGFDDALGLWTDLSGSIRALDLSEWRVPYTEHLSGVVSSNVTLRAKGLQKPETMDAGASITIRGAIAGGIPLENIEVNADWSQGKVAIDQFEIVSGRDRLALSGVVEPFRHSTGLDLVLHLEEPERLLDRLSKNLPQIPSMLTLQGQTDFTVAIDRWFDDPRARFSFRSGAVSYDRIRAKTVRLTGIWQGLPGPENRVDDLSFTAGKMAIEQVGSGAFSLAGNWYGWLDNPSARFSIKVRNVTGDRLDIDMLNLTGDLQGPPSADDSRANLMLMADGVRMDKIESGRLSLSGSWRGPLSGFAGHAELDAGRLLFQDNVISGLVLTADVTPDEAVVSISTNHENGSIFEMNARAAPWAVPEKSVTVENLLLSLRSPWPVLTVKTADPIRFSTGGGGVTVKSCHLEMNDATFSVEGSLSADGNQDVNLSIDNLQIDEIPGYWNDNARFSGSITGEATLRGTIARPEISSHLAVKNLMGYNIPQATDLESSVDYVGETATFQATLLKHDTPILSTAGNAPVRFSLAPFSVSEGPGSMEATLETRNLRFSELPIPQLKGIAWDAVADMNLLASGNIRKPDISGSISIHDGHLTLTRNKLTYEQVGGKLLLSNNRVTIEELMISGNREGRLSASGEIVIGDKERFNTDLTVIGENFYIPFQKAVSARISPRLHLTGGLNNPNLTGEVTITESKINLDRLAEQQYSDIQVVDTASGNGDTPLVVAPESHGPNYLSPLTADILVQVPKNAWLKGQDVNAEIAGEVTIKKKPGGAFLLSGPLHTLRGNYYFMGKNFRLTKGDVEFLGLKEINPNLNIEAQTRIKSTDIIVTLHGTASEIAIDLSSDPVMEESDIISYLVFGRSSDSLGGNKAFNVEKAALGYTGGLLAGELRNLLGDVFFIDSFAIDSGNSENGFGSVTLGKYITPEIFISHRQGLSENDPSYEEITYELTPQLKLETQIGRDNTSSGDLTWEFDF